MPHCAPPTEGCRLAAWPRSSPTPAACCTTHHTHTHQIPTNQPQVRKIPNLKTKKAQLIEIQVNGGSVADKVDFGVKLFEKVSVECAGLDAASFLMLCSLAL
jgi:ribosomal protein L3